MAGFESCDGMTWGLWIKIQSWEAAAVGKNISKVQDTTESCGILLKAEPNSDEPIGPF